MTPESTSAAPVVDVSAAPVVEAPVVKPNLPEMANITRARRMAKAIFGPLARIKTDPDGYSVVYVQRGDNRADLGYGDDFNKALEAAYVNTLATDKDHTTPPDVITVRTRNVVEDKRRGLFIKLPDEAQETIASLHPNEVLEVAGLVQIRDYESIRPITTAASERAAKRKEQLARLQAAVDAAPQAPVA